VRCPDHHITRTVDSPINDNPDDVNERADDVNHDHADGGRRNHNRPGDSRRPGGRHPGAFVGDIGDHDNDCDALDIDTVDNVFATGHHRDHDAADHNDGHGPADSVSGTGVRTGRAAGDERGTWLTDRGQRPRFPTHSTTELQVNTEVLTERPRGKPGGEHSPLTSRVHGLFSFLDALHEPVVEFDARGRIGFANRAFRSLLGGADPSAEDADAARSRRASKPFWLPEAEFDRWQMFVELHHTGRAEEFGIGAVPFTIEPPGSAPVACRFTGEPLKSPDGDLVGFVAVVHPQTDLQRTERRTVDELAAELRRLAAAVRDLASRDLTSRERALAHVSGDAEAHALTPTAIDHETFERAIHDLSERERAILRCLLEGKRTATIAREFFLSEHTVRNHLKRIYRKAGVHSLGELRENLTPLADVLHHPTNEANHAS
jgi:DNA-binding CsgD family transcriptional regulator/PAS domain-containing protein